MGTHKDNIKKVRARIREFEDRKISATQLSREITHTAREINGEDESELRRTIERLGAKIAVLAEKGLAQPVHADVLSLVDELEMNLVQWGY